MKWQGAKHEFGCLERRFTKINGFDESFIGWGRDSDLVVRLINNGVRRKEGLLQLASTTYGTS